jgi:putative DNA primase/helicase
VDFEARTEWSAILPDGWHLDSSGGGRDYYTRPDKASGKSASIVGNWLYVFTTNAPPFEANGKYTKFDAYALLNHQGDSKAAVKDLVRRGFGTYVDHDGEIKPNPPPKDWAKRKPGGDADGTTSADGDGHPPDDVDVNEDKDDPHRLARLFIRGQFLHRRLATLVYYKGEFWRWSSAAYRTIADHELAARMTTAIRAEFERLNRIAIELWAKRGEDKKDAPKPVVRKVTRDVVGNAMQAVKGMVLRGGDQPVPAWLTGSPPFDPIETIPCRNALVHIPGLVDGKPAILPPSPAFFSTYSLGFDFDAQAPQPSGWIRFLSQLWEEDPEAISALQEWFGYCLTPDTRQQKILSIIGPRRSGKGTIARILTALIGPENVAGPTLTSLATNFGLSPLIGKPLAIISDARMSTRTDQAVVAERMLAISGEDTIDIDRKHLAQWTGKLPTRLVLISNVLPQIKDASGALPGRMILLRLKTSFYDKEDPELLAKLLPELPGILLWAIEGWRRLRERGRFVQPQSGIELMEQLEDLASPVGAFIRQRCAVGPGEMVEVADLYTAWCNWCETVGMKTGTTQIFGRDLRAAVPGLGDKQESEGSREDRVRTRFYVGIGLKQGS